MTELDDYWERRSRDLMRGLWDYLSAFERADPKVLEAAREDLEEIPGRIDRLLRKNTRAAA
jgi:hypothetical protein